MADIEEFPERGGVRGGKYIDTSKSAEVIDMFGPRPVQESSLVDPTHISVSQKPKYPPPAPQVPQMLPDVFHFRPSESSLPNLQTLVSEGLPKAELDLADIESGLEVFSVQTNYSSRATPMQRSAIHSLRTFFAALRMATNKK
ncbi:MAG TPA: hypothetical protein VMH91_04365 [Candidatus Paceibacterota bacterium]|nr:hypothetical protein [Candidatus Paceibacterota bacterium]